jgi:hypothetical protein
LLARRVASQYWAIDEYVYPSFPQNVIAVSESAYQERMSNVYSRCSVTTWRSRQIRNGCFVWNRI